jgi:pSer/pThr/pTyr-binding forkhead associated (FHA) protein
MQPPRDGDPLAPHSLSATELKQLIAAQRTREPFLAFRDERGRLQFLVLNGEAEPMTLGRRVEMDVSLPWDAEVSGLHAQLHHVAGEWAIVDDGLSKNGTYVNEQRIAGRRRLRGGDRIRVGRTVLAYDASVAMPAQETLAASDQPVQRRLTDSQRRVLVALCRPYRDGGRFTTPATNREIAEEVFLSVEAVKMHLRALFAMFDLGELAQNEKRARLAESAFHSGVIAPGDLE